MKYRLLTVLGVALITLLGSSLSAQAEGSTKVSVGVMSAIGWSDDQAILLGSDHGGTSWSRTTEADGDRTIIISSL